MLRSPMHQAPVSSDQSCQSGFPGISDPHARTRMENPELLFTSSLELHGGGIDGEVGDFRGGGHAGGQPGGHGEVGDGAHFLLECSWGGRSGRICAQVEDNKTGCECGCYSEVMLYVVIRSGTGW